MCDENVAHLYVHDCQTFELCEGHIRIEPPFLLFKTESAIWLFLERHVSRHTDCVDMSGATSHSLARSLAHKITADEKLLDLRVVPASQDNYL